MTKVEIVSNNNTESGDETAEEISPPVPPEKYTSPAIHTEALIKAESDTIVNMVTSNIKELNENFSKRIEEIENLVRQIQNVEELKQVQADGNDNNFKDSATVIEGPDISYDVNIEEAREFFYVLSSLIERSIKEQLPVIEKQLNDVIKKKLMENRTDIFSKTYQAFIKGSLLTQDHKKNKKKKMAAKKKRSLYVPKYITPDKYFYLENGEVLKNIEDLWKKLPDIQVSLYEKHVNKDKNDFASWVEFVFDEKKLAEKLRKSKDKNHMIKIVRKFLGK